MALPVDLMPRAARAVLCLALFVCAVASCDDAPYGTAGEFDDWTLQLSWAPSFCDSHRSPSTGECVREGNAYKFKWVLHGLWPNYVDARNGFCGPQYCSEASPSGDAALKTALQDLPEANELFPEWNTKTSGGGSMAQHEWYRHGSCSGWDATTYLRSLLSETL